MDFTIRNIISSDLDAADQINQAAFGTPGSRLPDLERLLAVQPDGLLIAERAGQPVGMGLALNYGTFAYVGNMAVLPSFQGLGAGRKLLTALLEWLDATGCPQVRLDATEAGARLYRTMGFEPAGESLLFLGPGDEQPPARPGVIQPLTPESIAELAAFDRPLFGGDRSALLTRLLSDFPGRAFASFDETGQMTGFLIAQSGRIGPWVCTRSNHGEALLKEALSLPYPSTPRVLVPEANRAAMELLRQCGFQQGPTHLHMCRGREALPGQRRFQYGQTSYGAG